MKSTMGRGRRGRRDHSRQIDEKWILKPFPDRNPETRKTNQQPDLQNPSASSSTPLNEPTTSEPMSEFIARTSKQLPNRGKPVGVSRNRRGRAFKPRFVDVGHTNSSREERSKEGEEGEIKELGSLRRLNKEELCEEEEKGGGSVSELKNDSNGESIEEPDSVEDVDYVGRRLEELQLGVAEAELSEEELRINDQLQEDEVI